MLSAIRAVVILVFLSITHSEENFDGCGAATRVKNGFRRSVNYTVGMSGDENEAYICDQYITAGWYIFEGHQGQEMPTFAPELDRCGTLYPIWLNGTLPTEEEGVVERQTCTLDLSLNPCKYSNTIQIQKCGQEYAYYLPKTEGSCPEAYCIGKEIPCPVGESSHNGFTPGCTTEGFPVFMEDPTINFTVGEYESGVTFREVIMQCYIEHNETEIIVDVEWYMDDILVAVQNYNYLHLPAQIHENDWYGKAALDNNIRCEIRGRYEEDSIPGPMRSAEYYMGMVVGNLNLEVEEGSDQPDYYSVTPTIPVLCPVGMEDPALCYLPLEVIEPVDEEDEPAVCPNGKPLPQVVIDIENTQCQIRIPMELNPDENTTYYLPVYGSTDGTFDGDRIVQLQLRSPLDHQVHKIWSNYRLPTAYVSVKDKDVIIGEQYCYANNDPHMITFDGRKYDNQLAGEFWLYRHKHYPSEIQVYFKESDGFSKVCGAAVRSGGDLFIYDFCRDGAEGRIRLYECEDLDLVVKIDGDNVKIELPHGTKVELTKSTVKVIPSLNDLNVTDGLCGKFDLICGNDFVAPGGKQYPDTCNPNPDCSDVSECERTREHEFARTWRVLPRDSLYQGRINVHRPKPDSIFCSCQPEDDNEAPKALCSTSKTPDHCVDGGIADLVGQCNSSKSFMNGGSDDVVDEVGPFEYERDFDPPEPKWSDPWNEQTARAECENFLNSLQSFDTCINVPGVDYVTTISNCMEDIKITNETGYNIIHAGSFLSLCLTQITRNMSNFNFNNATGEVEPPNDMTDSICPSNCYNRGTCEKGECQCDDGYFGRECFYEENKVPTLYNIPNGGMCDLQSRPCQQTPVTGSYFLKKPSLSCHIEPIMLKTNGEKVPQGETITKPQFDHMERIMCPLPLVTINYEEDDLFTFGYTIAVSNDGVTQSDKRKMTTYDSLCMNCTLDLSCIHLANTCLLQGTCYSNDQLSNEDPCLMCDATTNSWAEVMTDACQPKTGLIAGITVLVVACTASAVIGVVIIKKKKKAKVDAVSEVELNGVDNEVDIAGNLEKSSE